MTNSLTGHDKNHIKKRHRFSLGQYPNMHTSSKQDTTQETGKMDTPQDTDAMLYRHSKYPQQLCHELSYLTMLVI